MRSWWNGLTLKVRLAIGFGVMMALVLAVGLTALRSARVIHASVEDLFTVRLTGIDLLVEADRDLQQLLVAERSLMFADVGSPAFESQLKDYRQNLAQSDERWQKYKPLAMTPEEVAVMAKYERARADWLPVTERIIQLRMADTPESRAQAVTLTLGEGAKTFEDMREYLNQAEELTLALAKARNDSAQATYARAWTNLFALGLGAVGLSLALAWLIAGGTSRVIGQVASGLRQGAAQVVSAANEVSASSQSLSKGANEQSAALVQTSASMEEMSSMTQRTAVHSARAADLMADVNQQVNASNDALKAMVASMSGIVDASRSVSKIIKTIDEIAFQTNLLALNAAVEAARAGEAGMGFAVVADEVRSLAQRAAQAARDTTTLIEESIARSSDGTSKVDLVAASVGAITTALVELRQLVSEVSEACRQQAQGIDQVSQTIAQMERVTQGSAAAAEECAAASEEMHAHSESTLAIVLSLEALAGHSAGSGSASAATAARSSASPRAPGVASTRTFAPRRTGTHG
jgi:methyl-accepting chemotaxis protein